MQTKLTFELVRETKGAVRYEEPRYSQTGGKIDDYAIGMLYLRKAFLQANGHPVPAKITVTVEASDDPLALEDL